MRAQNWDNMKVAQSAIKFHHGQGVPIRQAQRPLQQLRHLHHSQHRNDYAKIPNYLTRLAVLRIIRVLLWMRIFALLMGRNLILMLSMMPTSESNESLLVLLMHLLSGCSASPFYHWMAPFSRDALVKLF